MADLISKIKGLDNVTYDLQDKVSTFGNENLLTDSDLYCYSSGQNAYFNKENYKFNGSCAYNRNAVKNEGFYVTNSSKYILNTQYIVHFDIENTSQNISKMYIYKNGTAMGITTANSAVYIDDVYIGTMDVDLDCPFSDGQIHNVKLIFTPTTANTSTYKGIIIQLLKNSATAFNVKITNLKWEIGNKPTDWTPSCYDLVTYNSNTITFFQ